MKAGQQYVILACEQDEGWRPSITVTQILTGIQVGISTAFTISFFMTRHSGNVHTLLLDTSMCELFVQELLMDPNPLSPAQSDAYMLFTSRREEYNRRVKAQTRAHPPPT